MLDIPDLGFSCFCSRFLLPFSRVWKSKIAETNYVLEHQVRSVFSTEKRNLIPGGTVL